MISYQDSLFIYCLKHITKELQARLNSLMEDQLLIKILNIGIHPGKSIEQSCYKKLNDYATNSENKDIKSYLDLYTIIHYINEIKPIENGQIDITLHFGIYILQVWDMKKEQDPNLSFSFVSFLIRLINNNRWQLPYLYPSKNVTQLNLYGLTIEAKQLTGIKGWNPSIQAYAKDLHQTHYDNEHPKNLELFLINWDQTIRINHNIYTDHSDQLKEIIITEQISS